MQPDADWPSDINIDASAIDEEQEGGDMSVVFQPQQQREINRSRVAPPNPNYALFQDPFWGHHSAPSINGTAGNLPFVHIFDHNASIAAAPMQQQQQQQPPWMHASYDPHHYHLQPPSGLPPPELPPPTWMAPFPQMPMHQSHTQGPHAQMGPPPPPPPPPVFMPPPPRPRTSPAHRNGGISLGPRASISSSSAAAISGESSTSSSASSPHPAAALKEKEREKSSPTWSAEWLHDASTTPWQPSNPLDNENDHNIPLSSYLSTVLAPPQSPLTVHVDPYFGSPPRSEDQVRSAWSESYPTLGPELVPSFGRATYNRVRVQLGADPSVDPQTRLSIRLYILRAKQSSVGVADDFYWESLYDCQYIAGWSSIPNELSIVKPKKLRGEPTLSSAIFALRVSFASPSDDPHHTNSIAWSSMFSLVRRSYETLRRRNAQQAAIGKQQRSPSLPISEPPMDGAMDTIQRPYPQPPPFGRSFSTPDYRLNTSTSSSSLSSSHHGSVSGRKPRASASSTSNRPAISTPNAPVTARRSLGELSISISPTMHTYASTPSSTSMLSPPLPANGPMTASPWQIFSPSFAYANLPATEQPVPTAQPVGVGQPSYPYLTASTTHHYQQPLARSPSSQASSIAHATLSPQLPQQDSLTATSPSMKSDPGGMMMDGGSPSLATSTIGQGQFETR